MRQLLASLFACALLPGRAAGLALPSTWGSSMVLQSGVGNKIWGKDVPGAVVTITYDGFTYPAPCDPNGVFAAALPPHAASVTPVTISLNSTSGASLVLDDIVHGDVFVFSGQSNMQSSVGWQINYADILAAAGALGPTLRLFQVARLPEYGNTSAPQTNLTASIPWSRASAAAAVGISALGYLFGVQAVTARPGVPVGVIDSSWGGTAIQPWMSAAALAKCGADAARPPPSAAALLRAAAAPGASREDLAFGVLGAALAAEERQMGLGATPSAGSCLYNSMIAPLLALPITGIMWYQGESNAGDPVGYQCLQPALITDWRASWAAVGTDVAVPFAFVQLAAWPTMDAPTVPVFRVAVENTLSLPRVGMIVAADQSDPAGAFHPIHPPWKAELARRAWLWADNVVYGNASSPASGPRVLSAVWDAWAPSWGDFHWGTGAGSYVCNAAGPFFCGGIRVTFDQPIALRGFYAVQLPATPATHNYGFVSGAASGFEAWKDGNATAPLGWFQPVAISGVRADGVTLQLNVTWIPATNPPTPFPAVLRYAFHDYPAAMPVVGVAGDLPASPFNVSVTPAAAAAASV